MTLLLSTLVNPSLSPLGRPPGRGRILEPVGHPSAYRQSGNFVKGKFELSSGLHRSAPCRTSADLVAHEAAAREMLTRAGTTAGGGGPRHACGRTVTVADPPDRVSRRVTLRQASRSARLFPPAGEE